MSEADLLTSSSRTVCSRCYAERETVQADMVRELDLYATTSSEPIYRKLTRAAEAIAKDAIRYGYDPHAAFELVHRIAAQIPAEYLRDIGPSDHVPFAELPPAVIGELAYGLFHDWVLPHIQVDLRPQLEEQYGPLPRELLGHR